MYHQLSTDCTYFSIRHCSTRSSFSTVQKRNLNPDDCEGDVPPPKGLSRLPLRSDSPLRRHKHYRLVVEEVALPLSEFQFGRQLVSVVKDCVIVS